MYKSNNIYINDQYIENVLTDFDFEATPKYIKITFKILLDVYNTKEIISLYNSNKFDVTINSIILYDYLNKEINVSSDGECVLEFLYIKYKSFTKKDKRKLILNEINGTYNQ